MSSLFTSSEIRKAVWTLKNNKSPGIDQIKEGLTKYSPEVVYEKFSDIYNIIAATGKYSNEIMHTTKASKTERTNIKSLTNNSFIPS